MYLFESKNLRYRLFEDKDATCLYNNHLEDNFRQWIPNEVYIDLDDTQDAINFYRDCVINKDFPFVLAVVLKETDELIGDVGVNEVEGINNSYEIGFSIINKYNNRGYATEAVITFCEYIKENLGIKSLYGRVMKGNDASCKVLEKTGFCFLKLEMDALDDPYKQGMLVYKKN